MLMWPSVTGSTPFTMRSNVDFPQPLGPSSVTNSPRPMMREKSTRAVTSDLPTNVLPTPSIRMSSIEQVRTGQALEVLGQDVYLDIHRGAGPLMAQGGHGGRVGDDGHGERLIGEVVGGE